MKIKLLTDFYANTKIVLKGKGNIFDVEDDMGKYLIKTFPNWFEEVKVETKEKKMKTENGESKLRKKRKTK